jgi:hypothetical protein
VRILLRAVERCRREHSPGSSAAARLGAVVFIHRFGSSLNAHLTKPRPDGPRALVLTPLELIDKISPFLWQSSYATPSAQGQMNLAAKEHAWPGSYESSLRTKS